MNHALPGSSYTGEPGREAASHWFQVGLAAVGAWMWAWGSVSAAPTTTTWAVSGPDDTVAVAAARVAGLYAVADAYENNVEIFDVLGHLVRTILPKEIRGALTNYFPTGGPDGPCGLAFTDSGRDLFILVQGAGEDAVLRYDRPTDAVTVFARLRLYGRGDRAPLLAAAHFASRLYVGTYFDGLAVFEAEANATNGVSLGSVPLPDASPVRGLAVDAENRRLFVAGTSTLYRADIPVTGLPTLEAVGSLSNIQAIAYGPHFGAASNAGLYVLSPGRLWHVPPAQCAGTAPFDPTVYLDDSRLAFDVAATACGRLLVGSDEDAVLVSDDADARLSYGAWLTNEILQVTAFAESLVTSNQAPPGWVIDGDVQQGWSRFHPASPDAALWAISLLCGADRCFGRASASGTVARVLARYAGRATDGIAPVRSADGIYVHWIDPANGGPKGNWPSERATMSTMKIVKGAAIAVAAYPNPDIRLSASRIIDGVKHWTNYFEAGSDAMFLVADQAGGPLADPRAAPYHEGLLFAEEAAEYGRGGQLYARWLDRSRWPTATYLNGFPVTGNTPGQHQAAFLTLYGELFVHAFRQAPAWREQVSNLYYSNAAWTDDHGPRWFTVFSAGTTQAGYNADSLDDHPNDITTFPALMAFCATGDSVPAVAAYHAYRTGARQTFSGGASILYRRSNADPGYQPNSAGLPDVAMGAMGLMELIHPGIVDALFAAPLPSRARITAVSSTAQRLLIQWSGLSPDYLYFVEHNPDLLTGVWVPVEGLWPTALTQHVFAAAAGTGYYRIGIDTTGW